MHEQSIVESLLKMALENAESNNAKKIVTINVVIGALAGAVDESMEFYFNFLRNNTIASEATLSFRHIPASFHCRKCKKDFTAEGMDFRCPKCKQTDVDIIGGRELFLQSLEVE
jgi:hydrogenase nickel incorporation protein HypA/HybF